MYTKRDLLQLIQEVYKNPINREEFRKWKQEQAPANQSTACSKDEKSNDF